MVNFPLLKLPALALHEVTKMMTPHEIFKLAMCSSRLELFLSYRKYDIRGLHIHLKQTHPKFDVHCLDGHQVVPFEFTRCNIVKPIKNLGELRGRYLREKGICMGLTHVGLDNEMFDIHKLLTRIYTFSYMQWILYFDDLQLEQFFQLFYKVLKTEFHQITIIANKLSSEVLTELMNEYPISKNFRIDAEVPVDFKHPKALKHNVSHYKDARWLDITDLFSTRDDWVIKLETTNFDCTDFNEFLRYWVDCDTDIVKALLIKLKEGSVFDKQVITDQLVRISYDGSDFTRTYIKTNKKDGRKDVLGKLESVGRWVCFNTYNPCEKHPEAYQLLEIVTEQKKLEGDVYEMDKNARDTPYDALRMLQMRRKLVSMQLEDLNKKLQEKLIEFNGAYVV